MTRLRGRGSARAAALAAATLLLAACGQVHPGAAAVVGDTRIPMDEVDALSAAYCQATIAIGDSQGQPAPAAEGIVSKRTVLGALLQLEIARQAADSLGVVAEPSTYIADESSFQPLLDAVGDQYADDVARLVRINGETNAIQVAIGAQQQGVDVSELDTQEATQQAQQSGQEYIATFGADVDIEIDPRFGLAPDGQVLAETGSLSVPVSGDAVTPTEPADIANRLGDLPPNLVCR